MSRDSLAATRAEVAALLTQAPALTGVTVIYDHEPAPGDLQKPVAVTVSTGGMDPNYYLVAVKVYVSTEASAEAAWDTIDAVVMAVDARLGSTGRFGPSNWTVSWRSELAALVAESVLQVGREDESYP